MFPMFKGLTFARKVGNIRVRVEFHHFEVGQWDQFRVRYFCVRVNTLYFAGEPEDNTIKFLVAMTRSSTATSTWRLCLK